jgi:hypothetical protein
MHGGDRAAGVLLEDQGTALRMVVVGLCDESQRRSGALAAAYHFALGEAVRRRRPWLRTGGTRPVLSDGVLQFKRKWGAHVRPVWQDAYLAVDCPAWTATLRAVFAHHPIVAEARDGEFVALYRPRHHRRPPIGRLSRHARALWPGGRARSRRVGMGVCATPSRRDDRRHDPIRVGVLTSS